MVPEQAANVVNSSQNTAASSSFLSKFDTSEIALAVIVIAVLIIIFIPAALRRIRRNRV